MPLASKKYLIAIFLVVLSFVKSKAQSIEEKYRLIDTLGIAISPQKFDSLLKSSLTKFRSDTAVKRIDDYIQLIRLTNTITLDHLDDSSADCKELYNLFVSKYMDSVVKATDATISIGFSYYSKKYDLQIGAVKTKNNCFKIIRSPARQ
jgi:hypothetical protein